jgi:hypothetical protein
MEKGVISMESVNLAMRHVEGNFYLDIDGKFTSDTARQSEPFAGDSIYRLREHFYPYRPKLVEVEADVAQIFGASAWQTRVFRWNGSTAWEKEA